MQRKILFIDTAHPLLREELEKEGFQCDYFPQYHSLEQYKEIIDDYTGVIIRSKIKLDKEILSQARKLKFIGRVGAGMENIDVQYASRRGIICLNAPEGNRDAVGEHALGMLLALFNNIVKADAEVRRGIWLREENRGLEIGGKTIGIIGFGNTGSAFAKKLQGFGCDILAYDKYKSGFGNTLVREASLDEIFRKAYVVSLHVPLTHETEYLVDDTFIHNFKNSIYLINTSRGKVVNTAHLVEALEKGKVKGACLDVLEYEGLSFENLNNENLPLPFRKLAGMQNVVLSPHIAGWTHESHYKLALTLVNKIKEILKNTSGNT